MYLHSGPRRAITSSVLGLLLTLALTGLASADTIGTSIPPPSSNGASVSITAASLDQRVAVTLEVTVTCDPLYDVYYWETGEFVPVETHLYVDGYAQVYQAVGRSIASGEGYFGGWATCDGVTEHTFSMTMVSGTVPFRGGSALAGVRVAAFAWNGQPSQPPWGDDASSGPVTIRLR
jgi:hypothetical protein